MSTLRTTDELRNGSGAAAILSAGIGCAAIGVLAFWGDASDAMGKALDIYNPSGTLSGVTTLGIVVWLLAWLGLNQLWRGRTIETLKVNVASFGLLALGFLLTFPPFMDFLQSK